MILAIDTTREWGSIAIDDEEISMHAPDGYSSLLFGEIERLLARRGVTLGDIDCFAAAAGPGTFTGVRVGLTCAKGLAEATGKLVCAVSNLEALAEFGSGEMRAVTIDARRGDVYAAVYGSNGRVIVPERVVTPEEFRTSLRSALPAGTSPEDIEWVRHDGPLAAAVARVAMRKPWSDPAAIDANYVRRTDAELNLGKRD